MASSLPKKRKDQLASEEIVRAQDQTIIRLRFELGLGLRAITRSCSIGLGTAQDYLHWRSVVAAQGDRDENRLEAVLFGGPPRARPAVPPMPDFAELHRHQLCHPHVTLQLLWENAGRLIQTAIVTPVSVSCISRWRRKQDVLRRAGDAIPIYDARGGPVQRAHLFVDSETLA